MVTIVLVSKDVDTLRISINESQLTSKKSFINAHKKVAPIVFYAQKIEVPVEKVCARIYDAVNEGKDTTLDLSKNGVQNV